MSRVTALFLLLLAFSFSLPASGDESWSGTWRYTRAKQLLGELRTIDRNGRVEFRLELWGGPPAYNSGFMEGYLTVQKGAAVYSTTEFHEGLCRITFAFTTRQVVVKQTDGSWGECGFGYGRLANGTFARISSSAPRFDRR